MTVDVESQIAAYARWLEVGAGVPMSRSAATTSPTSAIEAAEGSNEWLIDTSGRGGTTRSLRWFAAAACALVVIGGLVIVAARSSPDPSISPNQPSDSSDMATVPVRTVPATDLPNTTSTAPQDPPLTPSVDPDGVEATPLRVTYQAPSELSDGWIMGRAESEFGPVAKWFGAFKFLPGDADGITGLFITTVSNLATDACLDHRPLDPPVGSTVDDLATALTQLAPFEVTEPPTDVTLSGYQATRLELIVPDVPVTGAGAASGSKNIAKFTDCVEGELHSWISPINDFSPGLLAKSSDSMGAFNAYQAPGQTEEFWILDVDGTRVVVIKFDTPGAPPEDVAERDAMFESIRIEP